MFSGIIKTLGTVRKITPQNDGKILTVGADDFFALDVGGSVAVDGVCLTVKNIDHQNFDADLSVETLKCSTLGNYQEGETVHLEKPLRLNTGIDGHLVSGHVDCVAKILMKNHRGGHIVMRFSLAKKWRKYVVDKASIAIDGVSLTVTKIIDDAFEVNIIPHTLEMTKFAELEAGDFVNIEFDMIAKYVVEMVNKYGAQR